MSARIKDTERTKLIAEFIKSGKSPEGFEIKEDKNGKYRVRRLKSQKEQLETKRDRLKKQLEELEAELKNIDDNVNDKVNE